MLRMVEQMEDKMIQKADATIGDWLTLDEAAVVAGKHRNTITNHKDRIGYKRLGYGSRSPLVFSRRGLMRWLKAYQLIRSSN